MFLKVIFGFGAPNSERESARRLRIEKSDMSVAVLTIFSFFIGAAARFALLHFR